MANARFSSLVCVFICTNFFFVVLSLLFIVVFVPHPEYHLIYIHVDQIQWHPFFLNPSAPKEGVNKREYYIQKFGPRTEQIMGRMTEVFRGLGLEYNLNGLTGNTLDSHRLIYLAGQQGSNKQHNLVEELFIDYFTQEKYIGDREFLVESANRVGVEGADEFLKDPQSGCKEVHEELDKYSSRVTGVPFYMINDKQKLSGAQPPEAFLRAFEAAAN